MIYDKKRLGDYITLYDLKAKDSGECFVLNDIVGISSITKSFVPTKANLNGVTVDSYKVVPPGFIAYNPNTARMGDKVCIALNRGRSNLLVSSIYTVFHVDEARLVTDYLLLWFKRPEFDRWARFVSHGSAREVLDWSRLCEFEIPVPPLKVQRKIVHYYQTISNRIALLQKINENLEEQAQSVFTHMFASNESVEPARLKDIALNITDGVHNTVHDDPDGEYLLLSCKNIKGGSLNISQSERKISFETFTQLRRRTKLAKGDVLISSVGTVGEILLLNTDPINYEFQRSVAIVKPDPEKITPVYLYEALMSQRKELINTAHGAVQQCLFISDIAEFPIGIPQKEDLLAFDSIVAPMMGIISSNESENARLSELLDTLLPCLMSGEIDVSDLDI